MKGSSKMAREKLFTDEEKTMIWQALIAYRIPAAEWKDDEDEAEQAEANYEKLEEIRKRLTELFE
jgi:hypothetical protein